MSRGGAAPHRVSLADVARRAGTSHSAASRALNGRAGVRPDLREAVLAAAAELRYIPNSSARNLVMQRTGLVALAFADPDVLVGTTFFADLVSNIVSGLDTSGYRTVLLLPTAERIRTLGDVVYPRAFDGAVVVGHRADDALLDLLVASEIPTVTLGRPLGDLPISYVDVDNVAAAASATQHLLASGRTRPALLACAQDTSWGHDRVIGFTRATRTDEDAQVPGAVQDCVFSAEGGHAGTVSLLQRAPETDALLLASHTLLPGVLSALADTGRRVPDDVALVTFDDEPDLAFSSPSITAVRQPLALLGTAMADLIVEVMADPGVVIRTRLPTELCIRESSGAAGTAARA